MDTLAPSRLPLVAEQAVALVVGEDGSQGIVVES
jgi:hypothetical protein